MWESVFIFPYILTEGRTDRTIELLDVPAYRRSHRPGWLRAPSINNGAYRKFGTSTELSQTRTGALLIRGVGR